MDHVDIFTDGACSGNPGPGGWGCILRFEGHEKELSGGLKSTTNNQMELTAAIEGLKALTRACDVTLTSDSKYLTDAINQGWLYKWQLNGWKKADKSPVLNQDLWETLLKLINFHHVTFVWVKGHDGHPENERCDTLAVNQINNFRNR